MRQIIRGVLVTLGTFVFSAASVILSTSGYESLFLKAASCVIYAFALLFLTAEVWLVVRFFRKASLKERLTKAAHRTAVTARLCDDMRFRTMVFGSLSLMVNLFFVLTKALAGWRYSSAWLCALALYYLALSVTKALILRNSLHRKKEETEVSNMQHEWKIYRLCGILLLFMTMTLQGIIILIVEQGKTFTYRGTWIFVMALYDFYCLISSVVYMIRTRKKHTPVIVSVKTISFAASLVSMLMLQTAMFASFGSSLEIKKQQIMNIITGTAVCGILIFWGILMIVRSGKELKRSKHDEHESKGGYQAAACISQHSAARNIQRRAEDR